MLQGYIGSLGVYTGLAGLYELASEVLWAPKPQAGVEEFSVTELQTRLKN